MFKLKTNNKRGVALFMVLGMLLVVVVLANVVLTIILSHARLTQHQVGRIQAYYASWAGINYAYEMLRVGAWSIPPANTSYNTNLADPNFPVSIQNVSMRVAGPGAALVGGDACNPPAGIPACISVTSTYTTPQ